MSRCPVARRVAWPSVADIACSEGVSSQIGARKVLRPCLVLIPCGGRPTRGQGRFHVQALLTSGGAKRPRPASFCEPGFFIVGERRRVGWRPTTEFITLHLLVHGNE